MQVTIENISELERKLKVTIPAADVQQELQAKLRQIASRAKMSGFRQGKVPLDIIHKKYAKVAHAEVLENLVRKTYTDAITQEKLNFAGVPQIELLATKPDEDFVYSATGELFPEIKLADLGQISVEKSTAQIEPNDIEEALAKMRKKHALWQEVSDAARKVQVGDQITIDFTATSRDQENKTSSQTEKDVTFVLGEGYMWQDFEQQLQGISCGEEKSFNLQMPDTHVDKGLAGKSVDFTVKVQKISEPILPPDDELLAKLHIKEGGMAKLREEIHGHMERELQTILKGVVKRAVIDKILALHSLNIPKCLIDKELIRQEQEWRKQLGVYGGNSKETVEFPRDKFQETAQKNVALGLIMATYIKEHALTVSPQEVSAKMQNLTKAYYDDNDKMLKKLLSDKKYLAQVEGMLLEEKVLEHLVKQITCTEKNISYQEALAQR